MPSGGTGGYITEWTNANGFNSSDAAIDNLPPGDYVVNVTDNNVCMCTNTVTIAEPAPLILDATPTAGNGGIGSPSPFNYNTYTIDVCGGVPPFATQWETDGYVRYANVPDDTNDCMQITILFLDGASWSVTVSDANGCEDQTTISSNDDTGVPEIVSTTITAAENNCFEGDGAIDIVVEGGMPPYTYAWDGPASWTPPLPGPGGSSITGLPAGWFRVTVTDSGNPNRSTYKDIWVACGSRGKDVGKYEQAILLEVYPNPLSDVAILNFSLPSSTVGTLSVYDMAGKEVAQVYNDFMDADRLYQLLVDASQFPEGVYIAKLETETGYVAVQKLIIVK